MDKFRRQAVLLASAVHSSTLLSGGPQDGHDFAKVGRTFLSNKHSSRSTFNQKLPLKAKGNVQLIRNPNLALKADWLREMILKMNTKEYTASRKIKVSRQFWITFLSKINK